MSVITDLLIMTHDARGPDERDPMQAVNAWCDEHADGQRFVELSTETAGGHKVFTNRIFACSGNYFPVQDFVDAFASNAFGWNTYDAANTICLVDYEHADEVRAVRADGVKMHGYFGESVGWQR